MAVNDEAELQHRIEDGCKLIRNKLGILERVRQSLVRRAARSMEAQGQHSEHFLFAVVKTVICNVGISDI
jgi:hypothetical protein